MKKYTKKDNRNLKSIANVSTMGPRFLTGEQLLAIHNLGLREGSELAKIKEIFLKQCCTGLRLVDCSTKFSPERYNSGVAILLLYADIVEPTSSIRNRFRLGLPTFQPQPGLARRTHAIYKLKQNDVHLQLNVQ